MQILWSSNFYTPGKEPALPGTRKPYVVPIDERIGALPPPLWPPTPGPTRGAKISK